MAVFPPPSRYPGPGRPPTPRDTARYQQATDALQQANPSDGGTTGVGIDSSGTQIRDWSVKSILARITSHGADNAYGFEEVYLVDDTGTIDTLDGGLVGDDVDNPAYEVNDSATVANGTVVELWPNYGPEPFWTFTDATGGGGAVIAVATVYAIASLGSNTYTVRAVHRTAGVLTDDTGPVNYTAYEAQGRAVFLDTAGSPTREYPLFRDSAGIYYFQIDQYTDGSAATVLPGLVSTTTQVITGLKKFIADVEVYDYFRVAFTIATPGNPFDVQITSTAAGTLIFGATVATTTNYVNFTNVGTGGYPSTLDGNVAACGYLWLTKRESSAANNTFLQVTSAYQSGASPVTGGGTMTLFIGGTNYTSLLGALVYYNPTTGVIAGSTSDPDITTGLAFYQNAGAYATVTKFGKTVSRSFVDGGGDTQDMRFDGGIIYRWDTTVAMGAAGGGAGGGVANFIGGPAVGVGGLAVGTGGLETHEDG